MNEKRRPAGGALAVGIALAVAAAVATSAGCGRERVPGRGDGGAAGAAGADSLEAAAAHVLVAYRGCRDAPDTLSRTREQAEDRARRVAVLARQPGADFADLARRYSDDPRAARTGGYLGIVRRGDFTLPFEVALFSLPVGEVGQIVETEYGWHVIQRLPVRRVRAHHILIAWRGAERATEAVSRTREQAQALAAEVRLRAAAPGADLCTLARQFSDDAFNSAGCGDLGVIVPGRLPPEFEAKLFRLRPGQVSPVIETPFGFHIVWREP